MLKHSSEKLNFIPKRSEMDVKAAENPKFSGYHSSFPSRNEFLVKVLPRHLYVVKGFSEHINESRKILLFAALTFISHIFLYEI
jgi:hypothetical protein